MTIWGVLEVVKPVLQVKNGPKMVQKVIWKPYFYSGSWVSKPRQHPKWSGRGEQALQGEGRISIFQKLKILQVLEFFYVFLSFDLEGTLGYGMDQRESLGV